MLKIPNKITIGGQDIEIKRVERSDNNSVGLANIYSGYIEIADKFNKDDIQSESCKVNTFYHELTHSILDTMGREDLSKDEVFVNCFAGFLTEAMTNAYFLEKKQK